MRCLYSLHRHFPKDLALEIIVINDASTDNTQAVVSQITGVQLVSNAQNQGFLKSCNYGAKCARGPYIYFLNNDTEIQENTIEALINTLRNNTNVGVVGSKLVYPHGSLQEAGGIIWKDASGWNYGREQNPFDPKYNYTRSVDYCSGASLMVHRSILEQLDGFAQEFAPAY